MRKMIIALVLVLITVPAHAEFFFLSGYELATYMKAYQGTERNDPNAKIAEANAFVGYVTGVFETLSGLRRICTKGTSTSHIVSVVAKYLEDHPERSSEPAIYSTAEALEKEFACKK